MPKPTRMNRSNSTDPNGKVGTTGTFFFGVAGSIFANVRSNLLGYIAATLSTFLISGILWAIATGGVFFGLPNQVKALETDFSDFRQEMFELLQKQNEINTNQQAINQSQQQTNALQSTFNQTQQQTNAEIKEELRDLNNYLRNR